MFYSFDLAVEHAGNLPALSCWLYALGNLYFLSVLGFLIKKKHISPTAGVLRGFFIGSGWHRTSSPNGVGICCVLGTVWMILGRGRKGEGEGRGEGEGGKRGGVAGLPIVCFYFLFPFFFPFTPSIRVGRRHFSSYPWLHCARNTYLPYPIHRHRHRQSKSMNEAHPSMMRSSAEFYFILGSRYRSSHCPCICTAILWESINHPFHFFTSLHFSLTWPLLLLLWYILYS